MMDQGLVHGGHAKMDQVWVDGNYAMIDQQQKF